MPTQKLRIRSALTIMVALLFAASLPAFAEHGSGSDSAGESKTASSNTTTSTSTGNTTSVKAETEVKSNSTSSDHTELHHQGTELVAEMKKDHKPAQTDAERQNKCESHKQGLTTKFNAIVNNSQRIQDKINNILAKAQTYKQTNNLSPANWDSLLGTAKSAQADSNAAIAALKGVKPTIDCNNVSVASDVATFKTAAQQARDKLKTYRTAVKALLQALEAVKPTTEGSN